MAVQLHALGNSILPEQRMRCADPGASCDPEDRHISLDNRSTSEFPNDRKKGDAVAESHPSGPARKDEDSPMKALESWRMAMRPVASAGARAADSKAT